MQSSLLFCALSSLAIEGRTPSALAGLLFVVSDSLNLFSRIKVGLFAKILYIILTKKMAFLYFFISRPS